MEGSMEGPIGGPYGGPYWRALLEEKNNMLSPFQKNNMLGPFQKSIGPFGHGRPAGDYKKERVSHFPGRQK